MDSAAIGIDLGTTNTVAAIYRNGNPEIIPNTEGKRLTKSLVHYDPANLNVIVGETANNKSLKCPRNCMRDIKRIIGRKFSDVHVQNYMARGNTIFHLQIKCGPKGYPNIILECNNTDADAEATKTPEEVSAEVLKYIKESTKNSGIETTEAVISVPAYFGYPQRAATKRAAEKAGFKVLSLITEPVAAAIYYTHGKYEEDMQLLMVDLGGGTLDVSVIKCAKDKFEVKSIEGDLFLGGSDFDLLIFDYLRKEIGKRYGNHLVDPKTKTGIRFLQRLKNYAVKFKHALSRHEQFTIVIESFDGDTYDVTITREQFEESSELLFQRITNKVRKCLSAASLSPSDIDRVVLVGGSTRILKLKKLLTDMFDGREPFTDLNPDEAVALGASIHAALLKNNLAGLERYQIKDVAPHSLGISTHYDLVIHFIEKGTALPATKMQVMQTSFNDQKSMIVKVYEGERKRCKHNREIGVLEISNLPPGRAGQVKVEVTFHLDVNGELNVKAIEQSTGNTNQLEIKMDNLMLCDSDIFVSLEHEQRINEKDEMWEQFYRFLITTDQYCHNIMYDVDKPGLNSKKHELMKTLDLFKTKCEDLNYGNIDILKEEFEKLKTNVQTVLGAN